MRSKSAVFFIILACVTGGAFADEGVKVLGGNYGWGQGGRRSGIEERSGVKPHKVLALSSAQTNGAASLDLALSFDEGKPALFRDSAGHYRVEASPDLTAIAKPLARFGDGAVSFSANPRELLALSPISREALLAPGRELRDFSIEFWLYPLHAQNGEQILKFTATRRTAGGQNIFQRIQCLVKDSRLHWDFIDFFSRPGDSATLDLAMDSASPLSPRKWSHHLVRFDSRTGLLEYYMNGKPEAAVSASTTGREGGDICFPLIGNGGRLIFGERYTGLIDEARLYSAAHESADLGRYPKKGGYFTTGIIDLGMGNSRILRVDADAGRILADGSIRTGFAAKGRASTRSSDPYTDGDGGSALRFYIRASESSYQWMAEEASVSKQTARSVGDFSGEQWIPFVPGTDLPVDLRGRYAEIAVEAFPSGDGEQSPYLERLALHYITDEAPPPPALVQAAARDRAVELSWKASAASDVAGYFIYYGRASGEYLGTGAMLGPSPIDAGKRTSITLDGLENGVLYYFAVAAYDWAGHEGDFSREIIARPLRLVP
jgi:hypothetical protein